MAEEEADIKYFWLTANPAIWDVSRIKKGETVFYTAYNEKGNKRRIFNAFLWQSLKIKLFFMNRHLEKKLLS
ncbi:hypothetical protein ACFPA1_08765 [Neobacillus sp. GCM10023253]